MRKISVFKYEYKNSINTITHRGTSTVRLVVVLSELREESCQAFVQFCRHALETVFWQTAFCLRLITEKSVF